MENISDFERDILVKKSGEWLERYTELLFKLSGFETERNKRIEAGTFFKKDVIHEIDIFVKSSLMEKPILIECKDVEKFQKSFVDSFIGKITDIKHSASLITTTNLRDSELLKFKDYCKRRNVTFLDGTELDELVDKLSKINKIEKRKKNLLKFLKVKRKFFNF